MSTVLAGSATLFLPAAIGTAAGAFMVALFAALRAVDPRQYPGTAAALRGIVNALALVGIAALATGWLR